jgi:hypothetical protein
LPAFFSEDDVFLDDSIFLKEKVESKYLSISTFDKKSFNNRRYIVNETSIDKINMTGITNTIKLSLISGLIKKKNKKNMKINTKPVRMILNPAANIIKIIVFPCFVMPPLPVYPCPALKTKK